MIFSTKTLIFIENSAALTVSRGALFVEMLIFSFAGVYLQNSFLQKEEMKSHVNFCKDR